MNFNVSGAEIPDLSRSRERQDERQDRINEQTELIQGVEEDREYLENDFDGELAEIYESMERLTSELHEEVDHPALGPIKIIDVIFRHSQLSGALPDSSQDFADAILNSRSFESDRDVILSQKNAILPVDISDRTLRRAARGRLSSDSQNDLSSYRNAVADLRQLLLERRKAVDSLSRASVEAVDLVEDLQAQEAILQEIDRETSFEFNAKRYIARPEVNSLTERYTPRQIEQYAQLYDQLSFQDKSIIGEIINVDLNILFSENTSLENVDGQTKLAVIVDLQQTLNELSRSGVPPLTVDGIIGPRTLAALNEYRNNSENYARAIYLEYPVDIEGLASNPSSGMVMYRGELQPVTELGNGRLQFQNGLVMSRSGRLELSDQVDQNAVVTIDPDGAIIYRNGISQSLNSFQFYDDNPGANIEINADNSITFPNGVVQLADARFTISQDLRDRGYAVNSETGALIEPGGEREFALFETGTRQEDLDSDLDARGVAS